MATKRQARANPAPKGESDAKPESTKVRASDVQDTVFKAIQEAGREGITLKALEDQTGIRYRVLHNVTWHLETTAGNIRRVGEGRTIRYATLVVEAKPASTKRTTSSRKSASKAA
jgi:hypothetical protein